MGCARTVALGQPLDATERARQIIILQRQRGGLGPLPNLCLHVLDAWPRALALLPWVKKHASGHFRRLRPLPRNRVRMDMDVEFLRQLRQRFVILERRLRDLRFPSWSYHHCSLVRRC